MSALAVPLWLDHASIAVPDLAAAVEHLDRRLGLRTTVSPAAPERHGRVYLGGSYLEVSAGSDRGWRATMFFLRFADPDDLRAHLDAAGIAYRFGSYEGVDGTWDDVETDVAPPSLSTLVRRTAPPDVARDWPPALGEPHRCGARALAAVHVEVPSLAEAVNRYRRLLGAEDVPWPDAEPPGRRSARVPLASGELVLREGGRGRIVGIVVEVPSLGETRAALGDVLGPVEDDVAWIDPDEVFGLPVGFTERQRR
jgi:catechol 2,3-dioxygenase-like lactoylglutathione lyase family enzyme